MDTDPVIDVTHNSAYAGTTTAKTNDTSGMCVSTYGASAPEVAHVFRVPGRTTVTISICGGAAWDSVLYVKTDCATTAAVSCDDDGCTGTTETKSVITGMTMMPGTYFIFVDGYFSGGAGDYTLSITGTVADGELCDPMQVVTGFLQCTTGRTCRDLGTGFRCQ
jgi:hypothetical protein